MACWIIDIQEHRVIQQERPPTVVPGQPRADQPGAAHGSNALAYALLFFCPVLFATNMLVAKATADLIPPVALAFFRWAVALLIIAPIGLPRLWRYRRQIRAEALDLLLLGALGMGVCGAFVYIGADTTTATNIGLIYSSSPVLIIILAALLFGQRIGGMAMIGVGIALAGVLTIIARGDIDVLAGVRFVIGDLWILAAATGWAVYSVVLKFRPSGLDTFTRFCAICLAGVLVLLPFTIAEHATGQMVQWTMETAGWVLLLALVPGIGAYMVYAFVVDRLGAERAALIMYLIPLFNAALAWLLLGEALVWYHYLGAVMVLGGIWLANRTPGSGLSRLRR